MKKNIYLLSLALMFVITISKAQTNAMPYTGTDCNGNTVDLFTDLDAGKAVFLHFYMPNCGMCHPVAQVIQAMANQINTTHPGMVKGYAFPYQNSTLCSYSTNWVSSHALSALYVPMVGGAQQVAYYGGFGMPTVVLLGGTDHRVMYSSLSFSASDTTAMKDSIMALMAATGVNNLPANVSTFNVFPNPANDHISINLSLNESSNIIIDVTDISGKQVDLILDEKQTGLISKNYDTNALPNGNYLIRLNVNGKTATQKFTIAH